ncbi:MAG: hypothetical protein NTY08_07995 [Proteobacteria bacterium]|nr:hypothetical protein [Pseudomonadota bacterium]
MNLVNKNISKSLPWLVTAVVINACGCVLTQGQTLNAEPEPGMQAAAQEQTQPKARALNQPETIPSPWHKLLVARLGNAPGQFTEAWGLFSSGGWADAGQLLVMGNPGKGQFHVYVIKPGANEISSDRHLSAEEFRRTLAPALKSAEDLSDLAPVAFDALTFYYEHVSVTADGKVVIGKRLIIRSTAKIKSPAHETIVTAFRKLR